MAKACKRCGCDRPVMCAACVDELVDRCIGRLRDAQSDVGALGRLLSTLKALSADPAIGACAEDHG